MTTVHEGRLTFEFDERWKAIKYDEPGGFADRIRIPETKKIDILAVSTSTLMMIEIKDFQGHESGSSERLAEGGSDPIHVEIAQKVRDTMSVLLAAYRSHDTLLHPATDHLFDRSRKSVAVIFFFERDARLQRRPTKYRSTPNIAAAVRNLLLPFKVECSVQNLAGIESRRGTGWSVANRPNER